MATITKRKSILDSVQVRWELSVRDAEEAGVQLAENVQSCCGSCVVLGELNINEDEAFAWTPRYQGQGYVWADPNRMVHTEASAEDDEPEDDEVPSDGEPVEHIYFHHGHGSAELIATAFRAHGFTVEWNGSEGQCVKVSVQ